MTISAVIVAAGKSTRMNGANKIFSELNGEPVLSYSLKIFTQGNIFQEIALVVSEFDYDKTCEYLKRFEEHNILLVTGGPRRQDSVKKGLDSLTKTSFVAIHDAARPCVSKDIIDQGIKVVSEYGSAVPVIPITSTIKLVDESGFILNTLDRNNLFEAQTPQFFNYEMIMKIHKSIVDSCTDDANMAELSGKDIKTFDGHPSNIKITSKSDLILAERFLEGQ